MKQFSLDGMRYISVPEDIQRRPFLERRCGSASDKPVLICAPSGFGKTYLAHLAAKAAQNYIWVDGSTCSEQSLNAQIHELLYVISQEESAPLIIIDGWHSNDACVPEEIAHKLLDLRSAMDAHRARGARVLVTTQHILPTPSNQTESKLHDAWNIISPAELLLSKEEMRLWVSNGVSEGDVDTCYELIQISCGIPSLAKRLITLYPSCSEMKQERSRALMSLLAGLRDESCAKIAYAMVVCGSGTIDDLEDAGIACTNASLELMSRSVPLIEISTDEMTFTSPTLSPTQLELLGRGLEESDTLLEHLAEMLAKKGDVAQATRVLLLSEGAHAFSNWIEVWGRELFDQGELRLIDRVERRIPIFEQSQHARAILFRAELEYALFGESGITYARAASAARLKNDRELKVHAWEMKLLASMRSGQRTQTEEALRFFEGLIESFSEGGKSIKKDAEPIPPPLSVSALAAVSCAQALLGKSREAKHNAQRVLGALETWQGYTFEYARILHSLRFAALILGETSLMEQACTYLPITGVSSTLGEALLGVELATVLSLCGRVAEARVHLEQSVRFLDGRGIDFSEISCAQGICAAANGEYSRAQERFLRALQETLKHGNEGSAAWYRIRFARALKDIHEDDRALLQMRAAEKFFLLHEWDTPRALIAAEMKRSEEAHNKNHEERADLKTTGKKKISVQTPPPFVTIPSSALKVSLFGSFNVSRGRQMIYADGWGKRKSLMLFGLLVLFGDRGISRDTILDKFWPNMDKSRARNNLYVVSSTMRSVLAQFGDDQFTENKGGMCRIDTRKIYADVLEFDAIESALIRLDERDNPRNMLELYRRMRHIYTGRIFGGGYQESFFASICESYHDRFLHGMVHASQLALSIGDAKLALWFARQAAENDSNREEIYQALMRAQMANSQRGGALETFHKCRKYLSSELGIDPSFETMELYNDLLIMDSPALV